jgi:hypothetical protein
MPFLGLKFDPIPILLGSTNQAVRMRAAGDLQDQPADYRALGDLPVVRWILSKQQADGSWRYPGRRADKATNYEYLETYRQFGELVEMYSLDSSHPAMVRAAAFLFGLQTDEGDFRGIYGKEYSPNYTAGVLELLVHAGFGSDRRVRKGMEWLLSMRQNDGGWAVPLRTVGWKFQQPFPSGSGPVRPDRTMPSSHMVTGIVLRAFAATERYRDSVEVQTAGSLLASRLFLADRYPDRKSPDYWTKFTFPFWFTDLVSALDTLSMIAPSSEWPLVEKAIEWFRSRQQKDGSWRLYYLKNRKKDVDKWVHFAICRALRRYSV